MQIVKFLYHKRGSPLSLNLKQCLLRLYPDRDSDKFMITFLHEILFTARKLIAHSWMQAPIPTFQAWIAEIKATLPHIKLICCIILEGVLSSTIRFWIAGYRFLIHAYDTHAHDTLNWPYWVYGICHLPSIYSLLHLEREEKFFHGDATYCLEPCTVYELLKNSLVN